MAATAFLGVGAMGEALLAGSLAGGQPVDDVRVTAHSSGRVREVTERYGVVGTTDNAAAVADAAIVVVAVRPDQVTGVLAEISDHVMDHAVVVSLADGISLADLSEALPAGTAVVRAMPSLTTRIGHGLTLLTFGPSCTVQQVEEVTALFARSGEVIAVEEDQQPVLGPVSSGGPAYFFYVADAMVAASEARGVPWETARRLVAQAMAASAAWLQATDEDAADLRAKVCSPGGAGARRMAELDRRGVRAAFIAALGGAAESLPGPESPGSAPDA